MRLAELLADISYTATNFQDVTVTDLVYDSRKVVKGCAFICLKGALWTVTHLHSRQSNKERLY